MVIIIMHKGLAYRKGSGGRGMFHLIIFVTTSLRFKWFCSIMAMKSRKGINGVCLSTKAAESFQGTLEHLRESFIQVFFSCAVLVGSAECIIGAAVWVTVIISQFLPLKYWRHCHQVVLCLISACAYVRSRAWATDGAAAYINDPEHRVWRFWRVKHPFTVLP